MENPPANSLANQQGAKPNTSNQGIIENLQNIKPSSKAFTLKCNIRLKKGQVAIPNQADEEFTYSLDSILAQSGGPLKGVSGVLERTIMPSIIDVSVNDNTFNTHIKEYWANFSNPLPCDNPNKRDTEQGILMSINFSLLTTYAIEAYEKEDRIDGKFKVLHDLFEKQEREPSTTKTVVMDADSYPDFIKLAFALKHARIANRSEDKDKSPKIWGYIYEKAIAVKTEENEMAVFAKFSENLQSLTEEKRANAILLLLGEQPTDADKLVDKKIIIYSLAKNDHKARVKVNSVFVDDNWEYKYIVKMGLQFNILKQPVNSKLVQHGEVIIGNDIDSAANYLKTDATGQTILHIIKAKLTTN